MVPDDGERLPAQVDRHADVKAFFDRAAQGDERVLAVLREHADEFPGLWRQVGNLAGQAERALIDNIAGDNELVRLGIEQNLRALARDLAGPNPTPLERLLVERIAACWLHLQLAETAYYQRMPDLTMTQSEYHQHRIDRAQRRYLAAIRALAQVRRLELPPVQVNIAEKQINVVQGVGNQSME